MKENSYLSETEIDGILVDFVSQIMRRDPENIHIFKKIYEKWEQNLLVASQKVRFY